MFIAMLALIGLLCAADQFTKYLTVSHFAPYVSQYLETGVSPYIPASEQVAAIPGLFRFTFRANTGGGFSILSGHTWLLILITAVFSCLRSSRSKRTGSPPWGRSGRLPSSAAVRWAICSTASCAATLWI
ncbi:MAG: signal peptidase II [Oscillospiraceae bacterium]|nr:signal peptidase II [Oscillospiraceae bacterium]